MLEQAWLIPVLPFAAFLLILFFGKHTPGRGAPIGIAATAAAWVISVFVFLEVLDGGHIERSITWATFGDFDVEIGMNVDGLAGMMFVVVTTVSLLVQIYSVGYMAEEPRYTWYFAALSLFTGSMLNLVIAIDMFQLLVGWELVGICSYLLIGHWWEEKANSDAAIKAFITTRTGDVPFMFGIFTLVIAGGTSSIPGITEAAEAGEISAGLLTAGALLLFSGAVGKSAQFPLHVWLPDAMAGPTPVSALIHAATMGGAGVYMVARANPIFAEAPTAMWVVASIGVFTAIFAAAIALTQNDIKKVLAYSTVSQLAYMFFALGIGAWVAAIFHLVSHGFFKGLLFMGSGSVIHGAGGEQDMRFMGGLRDRMRWTYRTMVIGSLALAGIPIFAGFFSKDEILAEAFNRGYLLFYGVGVVVAFMTAFYTFRMVYLTFHGSWRGI